MIIPEYLLEGDEYADVLKKLKSLKIPFGINEGLINVACSSSGPLSEDKILYKLFDESAGYASTSRFDKQFVIKAVSRILKTIPKIKTTEERLAAISSIISLYPINKEVATRLMNLIDIKKDLTK